MYSRDQEHTFAAHCWDTLDRWRPTVVYVVVVGTLWIGGVLLSFMLLLLLGHSRWVASYCRLCCCCWDTLDRWRPTVVYVVVVGTL